MKSPVPTDAIEDHRLLHDWSLAGDNYSQYNETDLPINMRFNEGHMISIIVYSILMVVSATGNITVLVLILKQRKKYKSRINMMLMHLAIADLLVTFLLMPLEIAWAATVSWRAGDAMCRVTAFFRVFGLYLSGFILVCISLDRYFAVLKPLQFSGIDQRGKMMVAAAWVVSAICSAPQIKIFHVERHPNITWYYQCITYGSYPSYTHELTYNFFVMIMMYGFPLCIIIFTYSSILTEIFRRLQDNQTNGLQSSLEFLGRAKIRTLKMTIIIVVVFFICWTPYHIMAVWYWVDPESARTVDQRIQKCLFLFACTNSCMNPIVYGVFNIRTRRDTRTQNAELRNSRLRSSKHIHDGIGGMDVVCLVSWKKPPSLVVDSIASATKIDCNNTSLGDVSFHINNCDNKDEANK